LEINTFFFFEWLIIQHAPILEWENNEKSKKHLEMMIVVFLVILILAFLVPLSFFLLLLGFLVFFHRTPFFSAALKYYFQRDQEIELAKIDTKYIIEENSSSTPNQTKNGENDSANLKISFEYYENQRYWIFLRDWTSTLLPHERPSYSDINGSKKLSRFDFNLLPDFEWEGEWKVVSTKGVTDADGWQYTTSFWNIYFPRPEVTTFCRRRRWKRTMILTKKNKKKKRKIRKIFIYVNKTILGIIFSI